MSCQNVCDVAAPNEHTEKMMIVAIRARVRPGAIGDYPEDNPAHRRGHEGHGTEHAGRGVVEAEVRLQLADGHHVQQEVHRVEHPAELRRDECPPLRGGDALVPRSFQRLSDHRLRAAGLRGREAP